MEKIVLLSSRTRDDNNLIKCLKILFPECEIDVHFQKSETHDKLNSVIDTSDGDTPEDKNIDKFMRCQ